MTYVLMYEYGGEEEELDTADTKQEADFLLKEYRLAFRNQANRVWVVRR